MPLLRYLIVIVLFRHAYFYKKKRYLYLSWGIIFLLFSFIKTIFYQFTFGQKETDLFLSKNFEVVINPNQGSFSHQSGKYKINCEKQADINLYAKVAYIDYNDTFLSSFDYYSNPVYDSIAPIDLSVFIGSMADDWKKYKVKHEKRVMLVYGDIKFGEWENIHIIPANKNIRRGFDTVKKGDNVLLKGFLINWQGIKPYDYLKMETALSFETISKERIAGRTSFLCMQLYTTELRAHGYIYQ